MRVLYIDIDSQRPDHLGCYGYHRGTSPNIDRIAAEGVRFDNYHVTDAPCLPSRTALWSGRFGIHNGVINHGGEASDVFNEGINRSFRSTLGQTNWMTCLRNLGMKTATISPFGERHSAFHWYAGFNEIFNTGKGGNEHAHEVSPVAIDWLKKNGRDENWFLHVNFWDPHSPYRTPAEFGNPFKNDPLPKWLTEQVRQQHWAGVGPHSAREIQGYTDEPWGDYPLQPWKADSMNEVRRMFDGYDSGVLYADQHIGRVFNALADINILDDTVIIITADHGENLGELNIYGDHQTADQITTRVPLIIKWPGVTPSVGATLVSPSSSGKGDTSVAPTGAGARVDRAFHYHIDFAATTIELLGGKAPANWDGRSFAEAFKTGKQSGRDYLVVSQGAWTCQRSVRFDDYIAIRSYHDGYHGFPDVMLFDVKNDPHEQHDLAPSRPDLVGRAMVMLSDWHMEMMRTATHKIDPMWTVINEGGPYHTRKHLRKYCERLRATDRANWAEHLMKYHGHECT